MQIRVTVWSTDVADDIKYSVISLTTLEYYKGRTIAMFLTKLLFVI